MCVHEHECTCVCLVFSAYRGRKVASDALKRVTVSSEPSDVPKLGPLQEQQATWTA